VPPGSLTVVGTGIGLGVHLTPEARLAIEGADELLHIASDPATSAWLSTLNPSNRRLNDLYRVGGPREEAYAAMVEVMLEAVRAGRRVCAAFYGHPGVFVRPSHEAVRRAREEGFDARMLPAISTEDCLFADLGVDPARSGCQSYDATDFLVYRRRPDTAAALVLWQITVIGEDNSVAEPNRVGLAVLADYLGEHYPADHPVTVYEASSFPGVPPIVERATVGDLARADVTPLSTLYVPPAERPRADAEMIERLRGASVTPRRAPA
jgi:uncharacterized protein YabN with tetrapyrrole methylase and pyrophosphatase domain